MPIDENCVNTLAEIISNMRRLFPDLLPYGQINAVNNILPVDDLLWNESNHIDDVDIRYVKSNLQYLKKLADDLRFEIKDCEKGIVMLTEDYYKGKEQSWCDELVDTLRNFKNELNRLSNKAGMAYTPGEIAQFADANNYNHPGAVVGESGHGIDGAIDTVITYCRKERER